MDTDIGILDPKGKNPNPLTDKPYSDSYKEIAKKWSKYPVYKDKNEILKDIKENQLILINAKTGSGKTVLLPKFALHFLNYKGKIAITLPKQIITKASAEFSAKTLDVKLGEQVGYQYKGSPKGARSDKTNLLYMTDGTLVSRLINDPLLSDTDIVICDELHERHINIDLLLLLLKETLSKRPEFKLILMSATINPKIFEDYYKDYKFKIINVSGETNYPIKSIFLKEPVDAKSYVDQGVKIIAKLIKEQKGDILFFVTSSNEATDACLKLHKILDSDIKTKQYSSQTFCVEVYSGMPEDKQILAQDKSLYKKDTVEEGIRRTGYNIKVVISTNVAESSLTIDGIKYVIESGYELFSSYEPTMRGRKLEQSHITKAQVKQRMGRAGRTEPGTCYHLYTEEEYFLFKEYPLPEIQKANLTRDFLRLLSLDRIQNVPKLKELLQQFIEPPSKEYINTPLKMLSELNCIRDETITPIGKIIINFSSLEIELGIALIYSHYYQCSHEIINIISMLQTFKNNMGEIFIRINEEKVSQSIKEKLNKAKKKFQVKAGDHLSLLKIYESFREHSNRQDWCFKNFINCKKINKAHQSAMRLRQDYSNMKDEISKLDFKLDINLQDPIREKVYKCLIEGYKFQTAIKQDNNKYKTLHAKDVQISRTSYVKDNPKKCFYSELFISSQGRELNIVSKS
jgi:HrpA-like RNA helicase